MVPLYKRILIAVDGSENSQRAALHAAKLSATNSNASITALYVLSYDRTRTDVLLDADIADLHLKRKERIEPIVDIFIRHQVKHELVIRHGDPATTIIAYANENNYDLVIIGSRGLNSFQEMLLGSVSHKVAKRVNSPVLIVK